MGSHRHIGASRTFPTPIRPTPPIPPPPPADFVIYWTNTPPEPDPSGNYYLDGTFQSHPAYRRSDSAWWLHYSLFEEMWMISVGLDDYPDDYWEGGTLTPPGNYIGSGNYSGEPIVRMGP